MRAPAAAAVVRRAGWARGRGMGAAGITAVWLPPPSASVTAEARGPWRPYIPIFLILKGITCGGVAADVMRSFHCRTALPVSPFL